MPLAGRTIVVTRPLASGALAEAIRAAGGTPFVFPLLDIGPASDPAPLLAAVERLPDYHLAVFISPNAVDYSVPALLARGAWPATLLPAAVGQGTLRRWRRGVQAPLPRPSASIPRRCSNCRNCSAQRSSVGAWRSSAAMAAANCWLIHCANVVRRSIALPATTARHRRRPRRCWRNGRAASMPSRSRAAKVCAISLICSMRRPGSVWRRRRCSCRMPALRENARALGLERVVLTAAADAGIIEGLLHV